VEGLKQHCFNATVDFLTSLSFCGEENSGISFCSRSGHRGMREAGAASALACVVRVKAMEQPLDLDWRVDGKST
jgi:hypothetical protein